MRSIFQTPSLISRRLADLANSSIWEFDVAIVSISIGAAHVV